MDDKEVQELIEKGEVFIGKIEKGTEKDHYDLNGVFLNKWGQIFMPTVYVLGLGTLSYGLGKVTIKIISAIKNKIDQRQIMKRKAEAYDYTMERLNEEIKNIEIQKEKEAQGKHGKESE